MTDAAQKKRRTRDPDLRDRARAAYAEAGTYRGAAEIMGLSPKRVWELCNDKEA